MYKYIHLWTYGSETCIFTRGFAKLESCTSEDSDGITDCLLLCVISVHLVAWVICAPDARV